MTSTSSALLSRRRLAAKEKFREAKRANKLMIKLHEELKVREAQSEQHILDQCGQLTLKLNSRIEELKENDAVAVTSKRTELMLARVREWSDQARDRLEDILKLENSPQQPQRTSGPNATNGNLDTTLARQQRHQQLSNSFYASDGAKARRSFTVPSSSKQGDNNNMGNVNSIPEEDEEAQVPGGGDTPSIGDKTLTNPMENGEQQQEEPPLPSTAPNVHVVEPLLRFSTAKGDRKNVFTIRNRLHEFKIMRISGVATPFVCKARAIPLAPVSAMEVVIMYKPPENAIKGTVHRCTVTFTTTMNDGEENIVQVRQLEGKVI